jgi:hypothetical protein
MASRRDSPRRLPSRLASVVVEGAATCANGNRRGAGTTQARRSLSGNDTGPPVPRCELTPLAPHTTAGGPEKPERWNEMDKPIGGTVETPEGPSFTAEDIQAKAAELFNPVTDALQQARDALCQAAHYWAEGDSNLARGFIARARRRVADAVQSMGEAKP